MNSTENYVESDIPLSRISIITAFSCSPDSSALGGFGYYD